MPGTLGDLDPSRGLLRFGLRFPIILYRLHLGWLLGNRILMLTTIGRKSGKPHHTVLEVVHHDRHTGEYVIASGWGSKSDWYRNILNNPQVSVHVQRRQFEATAIQLTEGEAEQALLRYAREHRIAFRELARVISGNRSTDVNENCRIMSQQIPFILLRPVVQNSN